MIGTTNVKGPNVSFHTNLSVSNTGWTASTTYTEYTVQKTISIMGVTSNDYAEVTFNQNDMDLSFSINNQTTTNGIIIYAKQVPERAFVIPTIKVEGVL